MAHTKPEHLLDLSVELQVVRQLTGLKEKSPGIFYYKSSPFLHFHDRDGDRWADVKRGGEWKKVPVPFSASKRQREQFVKAVQQAHRAITTGQLPR